jgi:hypothetical protein
MEYLSLKDATLQYKVSDRTLRTAIAKLPTDERAKAVQSKGNKLFVSSEFLRARFELRAPPPKVKRAKANADATPTDEPKPMPKPKPMPTDERATSNELIVASLQNEIANLHTRLQESSERQKELNYIIANLTKQIAPPSQPPKHQNEPTGFVWLVVGLVLGLFVVGVVVWLLY